MKKLLSALMAAALAALSFSAAHGGNAENKSPKAEKMPELVLIPGNGEIKEFYIGKYPITNEQYKKFIDNTGNPAPKYWKDVNYPKGKAKHPVVFVSYEKALSYLEWLGKKYPQYSFRLPSMEEWEYAASGGKEIDFPWGKNADGSRFNYNANAASKYLKNDPVVMIVNEKSPDYGQKMRLSQMISVNNGRVSGWIDHKNHSGFVYTDLFRKIMNEGGNTTAVNSYHKGKSPFGVYDMSGNAWEWTSTAIIASNGAEKGKQAYAIKGGSWYANANSCKITMRGEGRLPKLGYNTVGFRIAAEKIKIDGK